MKNLLISLSLLLSVSLLLTGCGLRDELEDYEAIEAASEDNGNAETYFEDADDVSLENLESFKTATGCANVTSSAAPGVYPNTVTIDFGTACTGPHGRVRSGKIIVNITAPLTQVGAVRTVTFDNYYVDSVKVEGTRTATNIGPNALGQPQWTHTVTGGMLTFPNGQTTTWAASRTIVKTTGAETNDRIDDVYTITGGGNGVNRRGNAFTVTIVNPLVRAVACGWMQSGLQEVAANGKTITFDYSYGLNGATNDCDRVVLITRPNGNTRSVLLRR